MKTNRLALLVFALGIGTAAADPTNTFTPTNVTVMANPTNGALVSPTNFFSGNAAQMLQGVGFADLEAGVDSNSAAIADLTNTYFRIDAWVAGSNALQAAINSNSALATATDATVDGLNTSHMSRAEIATNHTAVQAQFTALDADSNGVVDTVQTVPVHSQDWSTVSNTPPLLTNGQSNVTLHFTQVSGPNPTASNDLATKDYVLTWGGNSNWVGSKDLGRILVTNNPTAVGQVLLIYTNSTGTLVGSWGFPTGVNYTATATNVPLGSVLDAGSDAEGRPATDFSILDAVTGSFDTLIGTINNQGAITGGTFDGTHTGIFPGLMSSNSAEEKFYPYTGGTFKGSARFTTNNIIFGINGGVGVEWWTQYASTQTQKWRMVFDPSMAATGVTGGLIVQRTGGEVQRYFHSHMILPGFSSSGEITAVAFSGIGAGLTGVSAEDVQGLDSNDLYASFFNKREVELLTNALKIGRASGSYTSSVYKPAAADVTNGGAFHIYTEGPTNTSYRPQDLILETQRGSSQGLTGGTIFIRSATDILIQSGSNSARSGNIRIHAPAGDHTRAGGKIRLDAGDGGLPGGPSGEPGSIELRAGSTTWTNGGDILLRPGTGAYDGVIVLAGPVAISNGMTSASARVRTTLDVGNQASVGTNTMTGPASFAVGSTNVVEGTNSVALGRGNTVKRRDSVALGHGNQLDAPNATAIGNLNVVSGDTAVAIGFRGAALHDHSVVITDGATGQVASTKENSLTIAFSNGVDVSIAGTNKFKVNGLEVLTTASPGGGDMTKSVYDTGSNSIVDNAEAVGGESLTSITNKIATSVAAAAAAQTTANFATTAVAAAQSAATTAQSTANTATTAVAALSANFVASSGKWSGVIAFAGVTNPQPCGAFYFRGDMDLHAVTGCTSYITIRTNASGVGDSFTVSVGASNETDQVFLNNSASATWAMDATGGVSVTASGSGGANTATNFQGFYVSYWSAADTNATWTTGVWKIMHMIEHATNIIWDSGTNWGFSAGFLDETNNSFRTPKGWFTFGGVVDDGSSGGYVEKFLLSPNNLFATNSYNGLGWVGVGAPEFSHNVLYAGSRSVNAVTLHGRFYSISNGVEWQLWGRHEKGSTVYRFNSCALWMEFEGD